MVEHCIVLLSMSQVHSSPGNEGIIYALSWSPGKFSLHFMYLLTEWEGRTGKYLARGHGVRAERSEVGAP